MPLSAGEVVGDRTELHFEVDVSDTDIQQYLQAGLAQGQVGFAISSLQATGVQGVGDPFVNLATSNHFAIDGTKIRDFRQHPG